MIELHFTDDIPQSCGSEVLDCGDRTLYAISIQLGIGDLELHNRVDLHGDVVLGDHRLRREIDHLLL